MALAAADPRSAESKQFESAESRKAAAERQAEVDQQAQVDYEGFMARARATGEARRKAELARATAEQERLEKQAARVAEARQQLQAG